jgi:FtsP/CotA-like multicopper oxidase with cupredoxin domain
MRGSPARRRVLGAALGGMLAGLALTGCTSAPTATPTPAATSASASPSASTSASASPSASPTPTPSETSAVNTVTIDITIADGQVSPNGEKIDVDLGQTIVLNVTSDEADEIHAHTDGDGYELEVPAGKKVTGEFAINGPGSYEVESHHLEKTIVILNAR